MPNQGQAGKNWFLWTTFACYAALFPPFAMAAGYAIKKGNTNWEAVGKQMVQITSELPFLQSIAFTILVSVACDLYLEKTKITGYAFFLAVLMSSICLVSIGFYSAISVDKNKLMPLELVTIQTVITITSVFSGSILKFEQFKS